LIQKFTDRKQVLANSGIATVVAIIIASITGGEDRCLDTGSSKLITGLVGGIVGHYACSNGDTWSSELGILSTSQPHLITTFKVCIQDMMLSNRSFHI
jgi:uncharacterized membrane protein